MKKLPVMLASLFLLLTACGAPKEAELSVFAAASLQEVLTEAGERWDHPGITLRFNFDSSSTLKTQIEEGAPCDLFLSAGQLQMDQLEEEGLLLPSSRFDLLENKVALAVPEGNPANITGYDGLMERLEAGDVLLAMGGSDVPVGQYTRKILDYYGLDEAELASCITYGSNVREVTTQISEGMVDCGVIYSTDALAAGLTVVDTATAEMCGQAIYPAAVLRSSEHPEEARAFLDYLRSDAGGEVLERAGFTPVK